MLRIQQVGTVHPDIRWVGDVPIVNLHRDEGYELVAFNLGQLTSHHVRHLVQVAHL